MTGLYLVGGAVALGFGTLLAVRSLVSRKWGSFSSSMRLEGQVLLFTYLRIKIYDCATNLFEYSIYTYYFLPFLASPKQSISICTYIKVMNMKSLFYVNLKVIVLTGGNVGLGLEVAKDLAARGATLILACRSLFYRQVLQEPKFVYPSARISALFTSGGGYPAQVSYFLAELF